MIFEERHVSQHLNMANISEELIRTQRRLLKTNLQALAAEKLDILF